ncbi:MAG: hypothetical protein LBL48_01685 [Azoarcus sp.]|jgi:hypothetical protein|nr:hypothetical protein [Azoarcus sp.]
MKPAASAACLHWSMTCFSHVASGMYPVVLRRFRLSLRTEAMCVDWKGVAVFYIPFMNGIPRWFWRCPAFAPGLSALPNTGSVDTDQYMCIDTWRAGFVKFFDSRSMFARQRRMIRGNVASSYFC